MRNEECGRKKKGKGGECEKERGRGMSEGRRPKGREKSKKRNRGTDFLRFSFCSSFRFPDRRGRFYENKCAIMIEKMITLSGCRTEDINLRAELDGAVV